MTRLWNILRQSRGIFNKIKDRLGIAAFREGGDRGEDMAQVVEQLRAELYG